LTFLKEADSPTSSPISSVLTPAFDKTRISITVSINQSRFAQSNGEMALLDLPDHDSKQNYAQEHPNRVGSIEVYNRI
jgi:hypothetical protein